MIYCLFHASDLDGHCSGALVKLAYPEAKCIPWNYNYVIDFDELEPGSVVFFVDGCSERPGEMERLRSEYDLYWIDHHVTSIERMKELGPWKGIQQPEGKAGCELTWEFLTQGQKPMPRFVEMLGRYDVWDHSDSECLPFQWGCKKQGTFPPYHMEFWEKLYADEYEGRFRYQRIVSEGKIILDYVRHTEKRMSRSITYPVYFGGHYLWVANVPWVSSDFFRGVNRLDWECEGFVTFSFRKGEWFCTVYSNGELDASEIAVMYGGGGHAGAAGFRCRELPPELLISLEGR